MLKRVAAAREAEREARAKYLKQWQVVESVPYRTVTAEAIKDALEGGATKKSVLLALGTSNYGTVRDYLKLLGEDVVEIKVHEDFHVTMTKEGATIEGYEFIRDSEGDWEPVEKDSEEAWALMQHLPQ